MIIIHTKKRLKAFLIQLKTEGKTIGFIPTMGALHQGHIALVEQSKKLADKTICSIFVNPTQFNDAKDFEQYPITIEEDIFVLEKAGCDILYLPVGDEIYEPGMKQLEQYHLGAIETVLEGRFRPGHFQGVCQVVSRLLRIVESNYLFLGQKDYQQCMVIKHLIGLMQLNEKVLVHICPTIREASGLAMSSRNKRLNEINKEKASNLYKALQYINQNISTQNLMKLKSTATAMILDAGFEKVEYLELANASSLELLEGWNKDTSSVLLVAAWLQGVRLIDNININSVK